MKATQTVHSNLAILVQLLERLDRSATPVNAGQYRSVAERLSQELAHTELDDAVNQFLKAHPTAAEVYENLHYAEAGLCRAPLDEAVEAEVQARNLIDRVRSRAPAARS